LDPNAGSIRADASHIQQLVMNLCINARDAMPRGGTLAIRTSCVECDGKTSRSLSLSQGKYSTISVIDTGCGIPAHIETHIFEPFFTTKGVGKGTGLGLAMAYGIVQQHGGTIQIDSEVDVGTTFTVLLPHCNGLESIEHNELKKEVRCGTETILIAEDDPIVRKLAERSLRQAGYHILSAVDGQEATTIFKENTSDISLVLLDVMMPNMNGHDALKNIRAVKGGVPAIMCTGYDPESIDFESERDEDVRFLQKPFQPDDLLTTVRDALDAELCAAN
jgi:CheY-like chemotaxis protein